MAAPVRPEMVGTLVFGKRSDKMGRRRLFIFTLLLYLIGTGLAAFVTGHHHGWLLFFYATRFVAGMGIEPALAADPRPPGRGRGHHGQDRGGGPQGWGDVTPVDEALAVELRPEKQYGYLTFLRLVFHQYPRRAILGAAHLPPHREQRLRPMPRGSWPEVVDCRMIPA